MGLIGFYRGPRVSVGDWTRSGKQVKEDSSPVYMPLNDGATSVFTTVFTTSFTAGFSDFNRVLFHNVSKIISLTKSSRSLCITDDILESFFTRAAKVTVPFLYK